ncbi:DUF4265 domain-containing protein [Acidovorax sp. SUPP3434]|uniref:DUF4265 domain-containing protein n=1 Tax=Acidovorax sp. SUPP3434 TaxID=2920880 RepID=UPI0023DE3C3D|nr:DUF4265 domain-containing protein [Acidovorax sp. SUPP3434]GKT02175.1 DUF4265 domain-containing protein [Acidovorax sp. SUPP3434]
MEDNFSIIKILAGHNKNGPVHEELPAMPLDDGSYRLLASPGLALGLAKNDLISLNEEGKARLLKHGGNFCIQIYLENLDEAKISRITELVHSKLAGSIDGTGGGALAFSIPISNGFEKTNDIFDQVRSITESEYFYSNIYKNPENPNDETLTDWADKLET